ncbi:MAG: hypothetical protein AAF519_18040, partial [Bacteroidota bacterium]
MGKIINFPITPADRLGFSKAKKRKKIDLEELGQLNLFDQQDTAKTVRITELATPFSQALN